MVGNGIVKLELLLTLIFKFLRPQKITRYEVYGGHFEVQ